MKFPSAEELTIGVLFCTDGPDSTVQFLDTAAVDVFDSITPSFLKECNFPDEICQAGQKIRVMYICEGGIGSTIRFTSGLTCQATDSLESASRVDILYIPGTSSTYIPSAAMLNFIHRAYEEAKAVLTVCTGIFPLVRSLRDTKILEGRRATATRMFLPQLRREFPAIRWSEKRWEHDGKLWTSGGIANGLDLVAAFIKEHYTPEVAAVVRDLVEVGERSQEY